MSINRDYEFLLGGLNESIKTTRLAVEKQEQLIKDVKKQADNNLLVHKQGDKETIAGIIKRINKHEKMIYGICLTLILLVIVFTYNLGEEALPVVDIFSKFFDIIL